MRKTLKISLLFVFTPSNLRLKVIEILERFYWNSLPIQNETGKENPNINLLAS